MKCRHCQTEMKLPLIDLGTSPPSNAYLTKEALQKPEKYFPLRVLVCETCWLVQTEDYAEASELFSPDYAYFSSFSDSWLNHSENYVSQMADRFQLNGQSMVVEVAANDGYLLQYVKKKNIPCYGIEPTRSTAEAARKKGIEIIGEFFGAQLATELTQEGRSADLMCANNVLAHVPDINDFAGGFAKLLKPTGVATFEFPHLRNMILQNQFDTIYHEHYSYLSLTAIQTVFEKNGLQIFDVEQIPTHGGSLRVYTQRAEGGKQPLSKRVDEQLQIELKDGVKTREFYSSFQKKADQVKNDFLAFLIKSSGKKVAAYGAAAKGNTLMNYAGVKPDLLQFVVDRNDAKMGKFTPGGRIPIVSEDVLKETKPDYVVILPWNLKNEIVSQLDYIRKWDGKFVVAVPQLEIF
jgi:2-polyprenyl-3-methyl-5-hydroxy-6-metoxy-1,4-benzoquinol methylase